MVADPHQWLQIKWLETPLLPLTHLTSRGPETHTPLPHSPDQLPRRSEGQKEVHWWASSLEPPVPTLPTGLRPGPGPVPISAFQPRYNWLCMGILGCPFHIRQLICQGALNIYITMPVWSVPPSPLRPIEIRFWVSGANMTVNQHYAHSGSVVCLPLEFYN